MITKISTLIDREVQTSDTLVYRKDLPKNLKISAIDIGFRFTNGATLAANKDALDIINHLSLLINGSQYRFRLTGKDCYKYNALREGKFMHTNFIDTVSVTPEFWLRMPFGRFVGDPSFGLDTSKYDNTQIEIDYALSNYGTVGTHIITGTLAITILLHTFMPDQQPSFSGMISASEFWTGTTVASRNNLVDIPSQNPITRLIVSCCEDGIEDAVDITDIKLGRNNLENVYLQGKWYNLQTEQRARNGLYTEKYVCSPTAGCTLTTHIGNIKRVTATANLITAVT